MIFFQRMMCDAADFIYMHENGLLSLNVMDTLHFFVFIIRLSFSMWNYSFNGNVRFKTVWNGYYKCKLSVYDQAVELSGNLTS